MLNLKCRKARNNSFINFKILNKNIHFVCVLYNYLEKQNLISTKVFTF